MTTRVSGVFFLVEKKYTVNVQYRRQNEWQLYVGNMHVNGNNHQYSIYLSPVIKQTNDNKIKRVYHLFSLTQLYLPSVIEYNTTRFGHRCGPSSGVTYR